MLDLLKAEVPPHEELREDMGDISGIEVFNNQILVAIYLRPNKTKGGIFLTETTRDEDKWQGKVGLVLAKGPTAFQTDDSPWFQGVEPVEVGQWVYFRPSDGQGLSINGKMCRLLDDTSIRGRLVRPDQIW